MTQFNLESFNPVTWDVQFLPQQFWLTMKDIEDTPSLLSVKTSMYAGNFSLTADEYREVIRLSETKYAGIDTSGIFNWSVLPAVDMTWKDPWLYMTNEYFWFYDGTEWRAYIGNNGDFRFAGNTGDNYIQWNSFTNTVEVKGLITGSQISWSVFTSTWIYWTMTLQSWYLNFSLSWDTVDINSWWMILRSTTFNTTSFYSPFGFQIDWDNGWTPVSSNIIQANWPNIFIWWDWITHILVTASNWLYVNDVKVWLQPYSWTWSRTVAQWTWWQSITLPFTPSVVLIFWVHADWWDGPTSQWNINSWWQYCTYSFNAWTWSYYTWASYDSWKCIKLQKMNWSRSAASWSIWSLSFQLNWTTLQIDANFFYIAFP